MRSRLPPELPVPASAATLATRVGLARQKVNYHLHALEAHGLVRLGQESKGGGAAGTAARGDGCFLRRFAERLGPGRRGSESGSRSVVRELSHRPGRTPRPRGG